MGLDLNRFWVDMTKLLIYRCASVDVVTKSSKEFESSYLKVSGREALSLSFPFNQGRGEDFPGQHSLDRSTFSSFNFDGRLTAKDGGGCVTFATDE